MTEGEFRSRFNSDRRENKLTFVTSDALVFMGPQIAVGLRGPEFIICHGGIELPMADARFPEAAAG